MGALGALKYFVHTYGYILGPISQQEILYYFSTS